jgi:hypothetical protein
MNEDLKWLAENVHEWPEGYESCDVEIIQREITASFRYGPSGRFNQSQWQAARDELSGKPEWSDAPEWANWLAQDEDGEWWWFEGEPKLDSDCFYCHSKREDQASIGRVLGDWRNTLERRPENHSVEPTEKVWRGPEDGLPPVGIECEFHHPDFGWTGCTVVGHFRHEAICTPNGGNYYGGMAEEFRPIRSEEDKAVEEMMKFAPVDNGSMAGIACQHMARQLYRAEYRKQEDE